jgi:hypothetical protein
MQVVQTIGPPPNHGRMNLLRIGCTSNSKNALRKIVSANVNPDQQAINRFLIIDHADCTAGRTGKTDPPQQSPDRP